jgi:UDPglucose 6-dehydrogenase
VKRAGTKVGVIGLWHLGCVVSACLADLGYKVVGVDKDHKRIKDLNAGRPPLFEPGLAELIKTNLDTGRLSFTTDLKIGLKGSKYIYITYDTPVDDNDEVDLSEILAAAAGIAGQLEKDSVIIVGSQVPVGTCERIKAIVLKNNPAADFDIAYVPENLRLGQAIERFMKPDIIIIGTDSIATLKKVGEFFNVIKTHILTMDLRSAEMTKHAINAFLATSISFTNEMANLCEFLGADALKVAEALSLDKRIGANLPLRPGLGFAGGTLARDLKTLARLWDIYDHQGHIIDAVLKVNNEQNNLVVRKLEKIYGSLACLDVAVLGLTYKAGTSTLRRSAALEIIAALNEKGANVTAFDPKAAPEEVKKHNEFIFCTDAYAAAAGADALVIVTDWPEFKDLDFSLIKSTMRQPVIIDTRNMLDEGELTARGFAYYGVGRGKPILPAEAVA